MSAALLVANFDAEIEMARALTPGPHPGLPATIRDRLLRRAADQLAAFAPGTAADLDIDLDIVAGVDAETPAPNAVLAWAETRSVAALRARMPPGAESAGDRWIDLLWSRPPAAAAAERCNDRRFCLGVARDRGWLLAETRELTSTAELRDHLPATCAASADRGWSVKAPFGAAGRERVHRWEAELPADIAIRVDRLIARYGAVISEPWMPRDLDVGVAGVAAATGPTLFAPHRLLADGSGVARGIEIDDRVPWLDAGERDALETSARVVAAALTAAGYAGPFGIDAFVYTGPDGARRLHRLCEVNARMTFGLVARAHWELAGRPPTYALPL